MSVSPLAVFNAVNILTPKKRQEWISQAEDFTETFVQKTKYVLPHLARLFLLATYLEDGLRMWLQWNIQKEYMMTTWHVGSFLATLFVFTNLFGQIIPSGMILARKKTDIACGILFCVMVMQSIAYGIFLQPRFFLRSWSLVGGLLLLMVENRKDARSIFAGVPTIQNDAPKNYMQLAGRLLLIIMFVATIRFELVFGIVLQNLIGIVCIISVAIGYKTKLSALFLATYLFFGNFYYNSFWLVHDDIYLHDFLKYDFFQTFSVIGGLLYVIALGPGGVSVDARKKEW